VPHSPYTLQWAKHAPPLKVPPCGRILTPSYTKFFWRTWSVSQTASQSVRPVVAQFIHVPSTQTTHTTLRATCAGNDRMWQILSRCFYRKAKRRGLCDSDFFVSELIDRADRKLFKQTQLSHRCPNSLLPSSRLPYSRYSLVSRGHQFSLPQLNTVLCKNGPMFVIDVCFSTFSSVIPPHCIVFFLLIILFFSPPCIVFFFFFVICVEGADVTFVY